MKKSTTSKALLIVLISSTYNLFADSSFCISNNHNTIHIIGEHHSDENCQKLQNRLQEEAMSGRIILAEEGRSFGDINQNNIFGINDDKLHLFQRAFSLYIDFALYKIIQDIIVNGDNSEVKAQLNLIKSYLQFFNSPAKDILSGINGSLQNIHKLTILLSNQEILQSFVKSHIYPTINFEKINQINENHSLETPFFLNICEDISQWMNLLKDITTDLLLQSVQNEEVSNQVITFITLFEEYVGIDIDNKINRFPTIMTDYVKYKQFDVEHIVFDLHNPVFLDNIINIFESNKSQEKPFYVIVGNGHTPFLNKELSQRGYTVKLNDIAEEAYEEFNSHMEELHKKVGEFSEL